MHARSRQSAGCRCTGSTRTGATSIETALILVVLVVLIFGMFDLGIAVYRYTLVSQASRQLARNAIVRGEMATQLGRWGPVTYTSAASETHPIPQSIQKYLGGLDPATTTVRVEWLDGNNRPESRIRATVTTSYEPFITFIFGSPTWNMSGSSTMQIAH